MGSQVAKDYVVFPALAGPFFLPVVAGNAAANVIRNLWAFVIIFCGHFTEAVETFPESVLDNETHLLHITRCDSRGLIIGLIGRPKRNAYRCRRPVPHALLLASRRLLVRAGWTGTVFASPSRMRVLTIYAHHNPRSFCHAILESFSAGLEAAGHSNEVVDLHAIGFDPVFREHDGPNWIDDSIPDDVLEHGKVEKSLLDAARTPMQRWLVRRWIGVLDARGIIRKIRARGGPSDVAAQQAKVARAEALVFISPVYFVGFPAILKGWIERVFTLGFAFALKPEAWRGDVSGRLPLLKHKKALIINTTIWDERSYDDGLRAAMKKLIDEYSLIFPGVQSVEHVYFYAVHGADDETRRGYLERAYALGRNFEGSESFRATASNA